MDFGKCFGHHKSTDFQISYAEDMNPNLLREVIRKKNDGTVAHTRYVCGRCKKPVIMMKSPSCIFCPKHGCLCHGQ